MNGYASNKLFYADSVHGALAELFSTIWNADNDEYEKD